MRIDSDDEKAPLYDSDEESHNPNFTTVKMKLGVHRAEWCASTADLLAKGTCTSFKYGSPKKKSNESVCVSPRPIKAHRVSRVRKTPYYQFDTETDNYNDVVAPSTDKICTSQHVPCASWRKSVDTLVHLLKTRRMNTDECTWVKEVMRDRDYTLTDLSCALLAICRSTRRHTRCDVASIDDFVQRVIPSLWEEHMAEYDAWLELCDDIESRAHDLSALCVNQATNL